jgi:hypothetical protein
MLPVYIVVWIKDGNEYENIFLHAPYDQPSLSTKKHVQCNELHLLMSISSRKFRITAKSHAQRVRYPDASQHKANACANGTKS